MKQIDRLSGRRVVQGRIQYQVVWDDGSTTWEARSNMIGAHALVRNFENAAAKAIQDVKLVPRHGVDHLWVLIRWGSPAEERLTWAEFRHQANGHQLLRRYIDENSDHPLVQILEDFYQEAIG